MAAQDSTTSEGYVYFAQAGVAGPIKIGAATNILVRIRDLNCASPVPVRLVGAVPDRNREREFHKQFRRWRYHREWFMPSRALLEFIAEHAQNAIVGVKNVPVIEPIDTARTQLPKYTIKPPPPAEVLRDIRAHFGRPGPWFRHPRGWYVTVHGKQYQVGESDSSIEDIERAIGALEGCHVRVRDMG